MKEKSVSYKIISVRKEKIITSMSHAQPLSAFISIARFSELRSNSICHKT